jgi:hypothetical protein
VGSVDTGAREPQPGTVSGLTAALEHIASVDCLYPVDCLARQAEARRRPDSYGGGGEYAAAVAAGEELCITCVARAAVDEGGVSALRELGSSVNDPAKRAST